MQAEHWHLFLLGDDVAPGPPLSIGVVNTRVSLWISVWVERHKATENDCINGRWQRQCHGGEEVAMEGQLGSKGSETRGLDLSVPLLSLR